jgi:hypothetical protein
MKQLLILCIVMGLGLVWAKPTIGVMGGGGVNWTFASYFGEKERVYDSLQIWRTVKTGYNYGLFLDVGFNDMFGMNIGLGIETRGHHVGYEHHEGVLNVTTIKYEATREVTYLEFPLFGRISFPGRPGRTVLALGPEFRILIGGENKGTADTTYGGITRPKSFTDDNDETMKSFDMGIGAQLAYEIPIDKHAIQLGAGYSFGLTNTDDNKKRYDWNKKKWEEENPGFLYESVYGEYEEQESGEKQHAIKIFGRVKINF